jgi:type II secretory pathway pseudopilin PulG
MMNEQAVASMEVQTRDRSPRARRGFVLPTVVLAIAMMSIIVAAAVNSAADERRASRATRESTLSIFAAEAGLRLTYGAWPSTSVKALNPGDSLDLGWQSLPNRAKYRAVVHRLDQGGLQEYNVVVQGRRTGLDGGISTIVGVVGGIPVFTYGVFSKTNISLSGGGLLDSYDSEEAPYVAGAADSNATLWSNGNMDISKTTVQGDISATGTITYGQFAVVTGTATASAAAVPAMDINACPAGGFTSAALVPSGPGISYNSATGILSVAAGAIVNLTGSQYYFSQVILQGNSQISVNPPAGSHVEIIVSDSVNVSGGSVVNLSDAPTRLGFSSCGSPVNPKPWIFTGGADAAFSVYAPNHSVTVTGSGSLYGAVVASSYTATGGASLHYDEALARRPSTKLIVQKGTWSMLPGS